MVTKKQQEEIERIIYWWRRYQGEKHPEANGGKFYPFPDLDLLERRLRSYFDDSRRFDFDNPTIGEDF